MSIVNESKALRNAAAVEPIAPGRFGVQLSAQYTIPGGYPNGGYLQCLMANAALAGASAEGSHHLHATAVTTNYIGVAASGPGEVRCDVRRVGRGVSFVHATLVQEDKVVTESLVTLGVLSDAPSRYMNAAAPSIAPIEECIESMSASDEALSGVIDARLDPATSGWTKGEFSDDAEVRAWLRLSDGDAAWDAWSVLLATDAMMPATFPLGSSGWVPTLQLTSYVRRIPASEWLRARQWCVVIADSIVDERCELFDDRGEMVASSSQLAMVRFPHVH